MRPDCRAIKRNVAQQHVIGTVQAPHAPLPRKINVPPDKPLPYKIIRLPRQPQRHPLSRERAKTLPRCPGQIERCIDRPNRPRSPPQAEFTGQAGLPAERCALHINSFT